MKLKKLTLLMAVTLITAGLSLVSCGDDEPDYPDVSMAYGRWQVESVRTNDAEDWHNWQYETTYLTFGPTGLYEAVGYFGNGKGRWEADRSIITASISDGSSTRFRILDGKSGDWLELRATSLYGSMDIRCSHTTD